MPDSIVDAEGEDVTAVYKGAGRELFLSLGPEFTRNDVKYVVKQQDGRYYWHRVRDVSYGSTLRWMVAWCLIGAVVYRIPETVRLARLIGWSFVFTLIYFVAVGEVGYVPWKKVHNEPTEPSEFRPKIWFIASKPHMLGKQDGRYYVYQALDLSTVFVNTAGPYWLSLIVFSIVRRARRKHKTAANAAAVACLCLSVSSCHAAVQESTDLMEPAAHGLEQEMRVRLQPSNINVADGEGWTPLMLSSLRGHISIVRLLLNNGADPNAKALGGLTSLMLAAHAGNSAIVQALLAQKANVNAATAAGFTPLMFAAHRGSAPVVQALSTAGANVNARTARGVTPLMFAVMGESVPVVKTLLAAGSDVSVTAMQGQTVVRLATERPEIARLFMRADGSPKTTAVGSSSSSAQVDKRSPFPLEPIYGCSTTTNATARDLATKGQSLLAQSLAVFQKSGSVARAQLNEAKRLLEMAIQMDPKLSPAVASLAEMEITRPARAAAILQTGLHKCPDDPLLHSALARIRKEASDLEGALAADLKTIALGHASGVLFASSYHNLSGSYARLERYAAARDAARKAVALDASHSRAWRNYIIATHKAGDRRRSRELAQILISSKTAGVETTAWAQRFLTEAPLQ